MPITVLHCFCGFFSFDGTRLTIYSIHKNDGLYESIRIFFSKEKRVLICYLSYISRMYTHHRTLFVLEIWNLTVLDLYEKSDKPLRMIALYDSTLFKQSIYTAFIYLFIKCLVINESCITLNKLFILSIVPKLSHG